MTKEQKQAAVKAVEKGANITQKLVGREGECCILGSMLLECGVSREDIIVSKAATWGGMREQWHQLLKEKFGLNRDSASQLMRKNDTVYDTCQRRRELIRIILTEL